jgi:tRNA pseudouridine38-40 synthase
MPRLALKIEYQGTHFHGSQFQPGLRTVQGELEKALSVVARQGIALLFSGRTDTGVHARGQVAHCDWPQPEVDLWRLTWALNGVLPDDLSISQMQVVPDDFHARYSALSRQYVYSILNRPQRSAILRNTHFFLPHELDLELMRQCSQQLVGSHDFRAFKSTNSDKNTTVCRVERVEILNKGEGLLEFWINANHFVYNMVRIIVGTLTEIGLGKKDSGVLLKALQEGDRNLAGATAPAWGLSLDSVSYPDTYKLFESVNFSNAKQAQTSKASQSLESGDIRS